VSSNFFERRVSQGALVSTGVHVCPRTPIAITLRLTHALWAVPEGKTDCV
jgi:hypothetical protein